MSVQQFVVQTFGERVICDTKEEAETFARGYKAALQDVSILTKQAVELWAGVKVTEEFV